MRAYMLSSAWRAEVLETKGRTSTEFLVFKMHSLAYFEILTMMIQARRGLRMPLVRHTVRNE